MITSHYTDPLPRVVGDKPCACDRRARCLVHEQQHKTENRKRGRR